MTNVTGLLRRVCGGEIESLSKAVTYPSLRGDSKPRAPARYAYAMET